MENLHKTQNYYRGSRDCTKPLTYDIKQGFEHSLELDNIQFCPGLIVILGIRILLSTKKPFSFLVPID